MRIIAAGICLSLLASCGDPGAARIAQLGCGTIEGAAQITGRDATKYVIVGEFTETAEAPAAVAELACHIAARDGAVFVGMVDHFGGQTDAEIAMRERLAELKGKGAPITAGLVGDAGRKLDRRDRSRSEQAWAEAIMAQVEASGARRALLFVARGDAGRAAFAPIAERFSGYEPMPMHLPAGQVISLEIARAESGASTPAIRLYGAPREGFDGEVLLASMTRPHVISPSSEPTKPMESLEMRLAPLPVEQVGQIISGKTTREEQVAAMTEWLSATLETELSRSERRYNTALETIDDPLVMDLFRPAPQAAEAERRMAVRTLAEQLVDSWHVRQPPALPFDPAAEPDLRLEASPESPL